MATSEASSIGKYKLLAKLATGGMGEIFLARLEGESGFGKQMVVKRLLPALVADEQFVTPGYFATMGMPLLAGRDFTDKDTGDPAVAIVDRTFADRFWSVEDAIGSLG